MTRKSTATEQAFRLFVEQAEKMKMRRIFSDGIPKVGYKMSHGGLKYSFELSAPDEEDYRSFLVDLRPFLMNDEPIFFERIHNQLYPALTDEAMRDDCRHNRKDWSRVLKGAEIFNIDGVEYAAVDFFFAVAYGEIFHLDAQKREWLAQLPRSVQDWARFNVYSFGFNAARIIVPQANLIRKALDGHWGYGRLDLEALQWR